MKPRRIRLRFSLRTLLLLMAGVGVAVWWHVRSNVLVVDFVDGTQVRYRQQAVVGSGVTDLQHQRSGPCVVLSPSRHLLCRGHYAQDKPQGTWVYYDDAGGTVLKGSAWNGELSGRWTVWHANGNRRGEVTYGPRDDRQLNRPLRQRPIRGCYGVTPALSQREARTPTGVLAQFGGGWGGIPQGGSVIPMSDTPEPHRTGESREFWDNGVLRCSGQYVRDQRHGTWRQWDRDGRELAPIEYSEGRVVRRSSRTVDELVQALASANWDERDEALAAIETAGDEAVPALIGVALSDRHPESARGLVLESLFQFRLTLPEATRLTPLTQHTNGELRFLACWLLARGDADRRSAWFHGMLEQALHHKDLLRAFATEFRLELLTVIRSRDARHRRAAFAVLVENEIQIQDEWNCGDHPEMPLYDELQNDPDPDIARRAKQFLN